MAVTPLVLHIGVLVYCWGALGGWQGGEPACLHLCAADLPSYALSANWIGCAEYAGGFCVVWYLFILFCILWYLFIFFVWSSCQICNWVLKDCLDPFDIQIREKILTNTNGKVGSVGICKCPILLYCILALHLRLHFNQTTPWNRFFVTSRQRLLFNLFHFNQSWLESPSFCFWNFLCQNVIAKRTRNIFPNIQLVAN